MKQLLYGIRVNGTYIVIRELSEYDAERWITASKNLEWNTPHYSIDSDGDIVRQTITDNGLKCLYTYELLSKRIRKETTLDDML